MYKKQSQLLGLVYKKNTFNKKSELSATMPRKETSFSIFSLFRDCAVRSVKHFIADMSPYQQSVCKYCQKFIDVEVEIRKNKKLGYWVKIVIIQRVVDL